MLGKFVTEGREYKSPAQRKAYDEGVQDMFDHMCGWLQKNMRMSRIQYLRSRIRDDGPVARKPVGRQAPEVSE